MNASAARATLFRLLDQGAESHEPLHITGERNSGVLIAEEDWRALQETLCLLSIPGMRNSLREGMKTPARRLARKLAW